MTVIIAACLFRLTQSLYIKVKRKVTGMALN